MFYKEYEFEEKTCLKCGEPLDAYNDLYDSGYCDECRDNSNYKYSGLNNIDMILENKRFRSEF